MTKILRRGFLLACFSMVLELFMFNANTFAAWQYLNFATKSFVNGDRNNLVIGSHQAGVTHFIFKSSIKVLTNNPNEKEITCLGGLIYSDIRNSPYKIQSITYDDDYTMVYKYTLQNPRKMYSRYYKPSEKRWSEYEYIPAGDVPGYRLMEQREGEVLYAIAFKTPFYNIYMRDKYQELYN